MEATEILKKYWGYDQFRFPQDKIIASVLEKKDTLAILPTGGGKSLCFQVPAIINEGVCLVVSPLIALMQDQVNNLNSRGIKALALTGSIAFTDLERLLGNAINGAYKFLYLSPERLQNPLVKESLKAMKINLIAIDEAHCISHWGKDFRPAYLDCKQLKEWLPNTPMIALTASATPEIQRDIIENLQMYRPEVIKKTLRRDNLAYFVYNVEDKDTRLEQILRKNKGSCIVYVRNRQGTIDLSNMLISKGFSATFYHGGLPSEEKKLNMEMWLVGDVQVMVATNAFGMGIDKPNVRTIVHWNLPTSLEDYFQEAGRAGRDGQKAFAITLFNENDVQKLEYSTQISQIDIDFLKRFYNKLCNYFYIAYGEGSGLSFSFSLADFAQRYQFDAVQVFQSLEILDRNSVISFSQSFQRKATLKIIVSPNNVRNYVDKNPSEKELLYHLMRSYTGIYENFISFEVEKMAQQLYLSPRDILQQLERLNGTIIQYKAQNTDCEITFLMPREDDRTIYFIAPQIKWFNDRKRQQTQAVLNYMRNTTQCHERYLLDYFGEDNGQNCGICGFCIDQKYKNEPKNTDHTSLILELLRQTPMSASEICQKIELLENEVLKRLQQLTDTRKISKNTFNQYFLL